MLINKYIKYIRMTSNVNTLDIIIDKTAKLTINNIKTDDISNIDNIDEIYSKETTNKWIKLIPNSMTIKFDDYNKKDYFKLVANIVLDKDVNKNGDKKRNTLIKFNPTININEFNKKNTEWIYIFTINNRIVKIGGTRTGLKGRVSSYLCGHHIKERDKSGDCSKTNGYIYNTFVFYAQLNCNIQMYAYKLPVNEIEIDVFDEKVKVRTQTFHTYESIIMNDYKKNYNNIPILCDNSDPDYRD